jgi:hypothetical protein
MHVATSPMTHRVFLQVAAAFCGLLLAMSLPQPLTPTSLAETYRYVDDKGTVVFTDDPKTIPERYRARAKALERTEVQTGRVDQVLNKADQLSKGFVMGGLTPDQSRVLTWSFVAAVLMFAVMMFTGSSALRLLMRWLLILLAIGTTAHLYFSGDLSQKASLGAKQLERRQQQKAREIDRVESTEVR